MDLFWLSAAFCAGASLGYLAFALMSSAAKADREAEDMDRFIHLYSEQIKAKAND